MNRQWVLGIGLLLAGIVSLVLVLGGEQATRSSYVAVEAQALAVAEQEAPDEAAESLAVPSEVPDALEAPEDVLSEATPASADFIETNKRKLNKQARNALRAARDDEELDLIIKYRPGFDKRKVPKAKDFERLNLLAARMTRQDLGTVIGDVEFVEIDQDVRIQADVTPWNIAAVQAPSAWNQSTGAGVRVAVLDTGVGAHSDLRIAGGWNIVEDTPDYTDTSGHGTMVAGVLAATIDDAGIVGVGPDVDLYAVKVLDGSTGKLSDAIAGVQWAIDNQMDIVTMSFGMEGYSQLLKDVLTDASDEGILLVAASGNDGSDQVFYPAAYSSVMAVGAVDEQGGRATFSNYGFELELVAPGVRINSTGLDGQYVVGQGTSLAASHVAGVAALVWSHDRTLTRDQVRAKLRADALDLGGPGWEKEYGYGLAQANFGTANYTLPNASYYYEIYNITDYGQPNVTYAFWANGTGTIDDLQFNPGYYKLTIDHVYNKTLLVLENGTFFLFVTPNIQFKYSLPEAVNGEGVVWANSGSQEVRVDTADQVGECWKFDTSDDSFNYCYFKNSSIKSDCGVVICGDYSIPYTSPRCTISSMGSYHVMPFSTASPFQKTAMYNRIYRITPTDCQNSDYAFATNSVVNQKRLACLSAASFKFQGKFGSADTDWVSYGSTIYCASNRECDSAGTNPTCNSDDCVLSTNSICKKKDGETCSQDTDCLTGHSCTGGYCTTQDNQSTDLVLVDLIPIQVISHVDMVQNKKGYVAVQVLNNGTNSAVAEASVLYDGSPLYITNFPIPASSLSPNSSFIVNSNSTTLSPGHTAWFVFDYLPSTTGSHIINASVIAR